MQNFRALGAPPQTPKTAPPQCEFLATRLTVGLCYLPPGRLMNSFMHVELLREKLEMHMIIHQSTVFMHDGAPCYRLKVVKKILSEMMWQHFAGLETAQTSTQLRIFRKCSKTR